MKLYFLRHAEAEDGADDAARALTKLGQKQSLRVGRYLKAAGVTFDAAYSSPLVRARQTAELVLARVNRRSPLKLKITDLLLNEASLRRFDAWLQRLQAHEHVLLVGHNPSLTEHLARLLGVRNAYAVDLPKAALAVVRWEPPSSPALKLFLPVKAMV